MASPSCNTIHQKHPPPPQELTPLLGGEDEGVREEFAFQAPLWQVQVGTLNAQFQASKQLTPVNSSAIITTFTHQQIPPFSNLPFRRVHVYHA
jgi:hypothetical protein